MNIPTCKALKTWLRTACTVIVMLISLSLIADPELVFGRFGGGGGFSRGGFGGGGGFSRGGFGGGGFGGGSSFDRGHFNGGNFGNTFGNRQMNSANVQYRQEGRTDRTAQRNQTARQISNNREDAWNHTVDHWGGYHYWGGYYGGAAFAYGMLLGMTVATLPPLYDTVIVAGSPYYYVNGVYYQTSGSQYVVVPAPVGATVEHPPAQVTNVYVNNEDLGYSNGAYYQQQPTQGDGKPTYKVVAPPVGATVQSLPKDAKEITIGGIQYYKYAETYYQVFHSGSKVVYMVVKNPNG